MANRGNFEVLPVVGCLRGYSRKIAVIGCYIPPNYTVKRGKECLEHITDIVLEVRRRYDDPFVVIGGDFNQWDIAGALEDYADLVESDVGPSRGSRRIDRLFSNFSGNVEAAGTLPPLETDDRSRRSDHKITFIEAVLPKKKSFKMLKYTYLSLIHI